MSARRAHARPILTAALLVCALCAPARAQDSAAGVPPYAGYVTDDAHLFSDDRRAQLEGFLGQVQQRTGVQFAVLTVPDCGSEDPYAYKVRVFKAWGIGNRERNDGLLLLVAIQEKKILFETGYGLEGTLPDGWEARMLRDLAVPRFREGKPDEGIIAGVLAASQRIAAEKNVKLEWNGEELRYRPDGETPTRIRPWLAIVFVILFGLLRMATFGRRRRWYSGGGWGGGFGGFGGPFGGGGGGGGGFGGFGGGSSGGGGGGAGW